MKLTIFLDIDGVLNHEPVTEDCGDTLERNVPYIHSGFDILCARCIERLNKLIECAYTEARYDDVKIVCSSTWRRYFMPRDLSFKLGLRGFNFVIGGRTAINGKQRGQQILDYIEFDPTDAYIVLDDDTYDMDLVKDRQVVTNYQSGFDNKALSEAFNLILEIKDR